MLNAIVRFSLRFRGVIIALACVLGGYGIYTLVHMRRDVLPSFAPPYAVVETEAPGLSATQVAVLVTQPIENTLGGVIGLKAMRARSIQGLSVVTLTFRNGTGIYRDRQMVAEQLGAVAGRLPRGVGAPILTPLTAAMNVALEVGLTAPRRSPMSLRTLADWTVKPQLLGIPGVAHVAIYGGQVRQLQIQVDPTQLIRLGLSLPDVLHAAERATGVRAAGFLDTPNQRIVINTHGQSVTATELAHVVLVRRHGVSIPLSAVAQVVAAPAPAIGGALIGGHPGVILVVEEQYGANTLAVTTALEQRLRQLRAPLAAQGVILHPDLFRPARFITTAMAHLRTALLIGAALVIVVLLLFLLNTRTALISALAIPLSLLTAVIVLQAFNESLNIMVLGGLAIVLGEVADDAIVDVENIVRRLHANRTQSEPLHPARVILNASLEVRSAVVYATLIVVLAFLPVLSLSGVAGKLFAPLGVAYITATLASLGVALTVTPALAYLLLGHPSRPQEYPVWIRRLSAGHEQILNRITRRERWVIPGILIACTVALAVLPFLGRSFLPAFQEDHFILHMSLTPGTSLAETLHLGRRVSLAIARIPGVRLVAQRAGRAENTGTDTYGVNVSEFDIDLKPLAATSQQRVLAAIRKTVREFPGARFAVETYLSDRIEETISGFTAPIVVEVFGNNLDVIGAKAREVAHVLAKVPGAVDVQAHAPPNAPELTVRLRHHQLNRFGFDPVTVLNAIQTAYAGVTVAQTYQGNRVFDVTVVLNPALRQNPAQMGTLPLQNPHGFTVPLRALANITETAGPYAITENHGQLMEAVTAHVQGRALSTVAHEAKRRIDTHMSFPPGTYAVFSGAAKAQAQAQRALLIHALMALAGIVILLFLALRTLRAVLLVSLNLPFALVGGVLAVLVTGGVLSLGALVGFVTLFGITLRNAIMLVSHYQYLVQEEGVVWGPAAAIRGTQERLVPILMTALVTGLGLLPLALISGSPGNEIAGPMAIVVLGGLVTSTVLNLLILPVLALRFGRFAQPALDPLA